MTILYIHGYGSNGNATKGQLLRKMLPEHRVVSPTFDYDNKPPQEIQEQVRQTVRDEAVGMIVGSSFGGYHTLCATRFFHGSVWVINPVHAVEETIRRVVLKNNITDETLLEVYHRFDRDTFRRQAALNQSGCWPSDTPLHFALSTDDELLGDHTPLLRLFPHHRKVVWKDHSCHRFFRFQELEEELRETIDTI